jgi:uncharacterized membrane protein YeaQ/YmgE (transglycosylase-associated protein family)
MEEIRALIESLQEQVSLSLLFITLVGFGVGLAARILMPGRDPMGLVGTSFLGIGGALLGTFIGSQLAAPVLGSLP